MKFAFSAITAASLATVASASAIIPRQACSEALRFGNPSITPSTLAPGQAYTITTDFTCSFFEQINPVFTDYYVIVPEAQNNGHEPPVLLARRQPNVTVSSPIDTFSGTLPAGFFFVAPYVLDLEVTYPITGTDGSLVLITGGVFLPINVTLS